MTAPLPPIYRDCRRLLVHTEEVVRRFSRYHKYTAGTDLRQQAMALMRGVHVAVYDKPNQAQHVQALVWQVDSYKLTLKLAIELKAFVVNAGAHGKKTSPGFAAFETAAQLAGQIGKQCGEQCGGWHKAVADPAPAPAASTRHAQVARGGAAPAGAGPKPVVQPPARPASLSEHTTPMRVEPTGVTLPVPVSFAACFAAWQRARRGKKPSRNQLAFETRWLDHLQDLHTTLRTGCWHSRRTVSFIVKHPKTREIHAPDLADRVVHHVLVERLEKIYEPVFIHDSFANRHGKGNHAAVDRLQAFMRQRENTPGRTGRALQLDVHDHFNSIHRPNQFVKL